MLLVSRGDRQPRSGKRPLGTGEVTSESPALRGRIGRLPGSNPVIDQHNGRNLLCRRINQRVEEIAMVT